MLCRGSYRILSYYVNLNLCVFFFQKLFFFVSFFFSWKSLSRTYSLNFKRCFFFPHPEKKRGFLRTHSDFCKMCQNMNFFRGKKNTVPLGDPGVQIQLLYCLATGENFFLQHFKGRDVA